MDLPKIDLMNASDRQLLIREIESPENEQRKAISLRDYEIYQDRQRQYVLEYLRSLFDPETVLEMPVISGINLARRIVKQEASLYKTEPKRSFYNLDDKVQSDLDSIYSDYGFNDKWQIANEYYKLMNQVHVQWVLMHGAIKPRILLPHHLDVVPNEIDPEVGEIYIISAFDKMKHLTREADHTQKYSKSYSDNANQGIGEVDDYKGALKRYIVWSKDYNFTMDQHGKIISDEIDNPLGGVIPIEEISNSKDFEYWVRKGESVTDFSVSFNGMLSDIANVVRMQGHGQAVFRGPEGVMPETLKLGVNTVLRLPIDPNNPTDTDFSFVTPNADIAGSLDFLKANMSMFLSSRGIDPKTISFDGTSESFTSGLDRLLSMVSKFEASKSDMSIFRKAEMKSYEIMKAYINTYSGTDLLSQDFAIGDLSDDSYMTVEYQEPEMIETKETKIDRVRNEMELGLKSKVSAYMELYDVDEDTAVAEIGDIDRESSKENFFVEQSDSSPGNDVGGDDQAALDSE